LTPAQASLLHRVEATTSFDFWKAPAPGQSAAVMTSPERKKELEAILDKAGIAHTVTIADVQQ
jgi:hypothetical protein